SLPSNPYVRGNVRERSLAEIGVQLARERAERPVELWGFCKSCPFAQRCRGGCTWTSHVLFGRPGNNPLCHSRALTLAEAGVIEKLELANRAPGQPFDFGTYRIVEAPLADILDADPVIALTRASQTFGLRREATGLWSKSELSDALAEHGA